MENLHQILVMTDSQQKAQDIYNNFREYDVSIVPFSFEEVAWEKEYDLIVCADTLKWNEKIEKDYFI